MMMSPAANQLEALRHVFRVCVCVCVHRGEDVLSRSITTGPFEVPMLPVAAGRFRVEAQS